MSIEKIQDTIQACKCPYQQIQELYLDQIYIPHITNDIAHLLLRCTNINTLSMNKCQLQSLDNFPVLKKLNRLQLMDNKFNGKELRKLKELKGLASLSLSGNDINTIQEVQVLKDLPIFQLDLSDTNVCKSDKYLSLFNSFKNLNILDNKNEQGQQISYEQVALDNQDQNDQEQSQSQYQFQGEDDQQEYEEQSQSFQKPTKKRKR